MEEDNKREPENGELTTTAENEPLTEKESEAVLNMYKRKRSGKYVSKLDDKTLDAMQKRKSLYMYLSTLLFAVSLFLQVEGRTKLSDNKGMFALFSLYVLALVVLIALSVYVAVMNRTWQKIKRELKEANTPRSGLDGHTFFSYECFNILHILVACAEVAVSVYKIGVWGAINIPVSVGSAVLCFLSRMVLYKANAHNLEYVPADEADEKTK